MPRLPRIVVPGLPHHVTQRGNRHATVFFAEDDYRRYLDAAANYCPRHGLAVWAYCLMSNHIHLIGVPEQELSLARGLRDTHTAVAVALNRRQQVSGHVWQGRFFSCVLDEAHLWAAVRYVERNPVRAGLVAQAAEYPWSSAAAHCGLREDPLVSPTFPLEGGVLDWAAWLSTEDEEETLILRQRTRTGRPCGTVPFQEQLQRQLSRTDVLLKKRGPKVKAKEVGEEEV